MKLEEKINNRIKEIEDRIQGKTEDDVDYICLICEQKILKDLLNV